MACLDGGLEAAARRLGIPVALRRAMGLGCAVLASTGCPRSDLPELGHDLDASFDASMADAGQMDESAGPTASNPPDGAEAEGGAGPTEDDAGVDAGADDGEGGSQGDEGDAATEGGSVEATADACPDRDADGVCDDQDSCPSIPNAGDETGAACACEFTGPTGTVTAASADTAAGYVGDVDIDDTGSNAVIVQPDAEVQVRFGWAATQCYYTGANVAVNQHIVVGLDEGAPACPVETLCTPTPPGCIFNLETLSPPCSLAAAATATLTAPSEPGNYDIFMDHASGACTGDWPEGLPGANQRIGLLCVR